MSTHQAARLYIIPKLLHKQDVHRIGRYPNTTKDKGIIFKPDKKYLEYYVNAE